MKTKFLEKAYSELNENIKFSEAKNAALITLNSALIAACSSKVFDANILIYWRVAIVVFTVLLIIPLVISLFSFRATTNSEKCVVKKIYDFLNNKNIIESTPEKYMYFAFIAKHYNDKPEDYLKDVFSKSSINEFDVFEQQMARQIVDLSGVAFRKFILFNIAIRIECTIFLLGGLSALIISIIKLICQMH